MVFCSLIASSAIRAFISALKLRRCLDFISAPFPRQRFYTLLTGPNFGEHLKERVDEIETIAARHGIYLAPLYNADGPLEDGLDARWNGREDESMGERPSRTVGRIERRTSGHRRSSHVRADLMGGLSAPYFI